MNTLVIFWLFFLLTKYSIQYTTRRGSWPHFLGLFALHFPVVVICNKWLYSFLGQGSIRQVRSTKWMIRKGIQSHWNLHDAKNGLPFESIAQVFGIHGPFDVSDKYVVVFRAPELGSIDVAPIKIRRFAFIDWLLLLFDERSIAAASAFWFDENCPVVQVKHSVLKQRKLFQLFKKSTSSENDRDSNSKSE